MVPRVSVLMSVYNGEKYLFDAIDSILRQTYKDFEFLIINDGSSDSSCDIINAFNDSRIRIVNNPTNIGLTNSLNKGIDLARGEYIARIDADDVAVPERLEAQLAYLEIHHGTALVSSAVLIIDDRGNDIRTYVPPQDPILMSWHLIFRNPIRHSSVMWRKKMVEKTIGKFNPDFRLAQDYELWSRINQRFSIGTIEKVLIKFRMHNSMLSTVQYNLQNDFAVQVTKNQLAAPSFRMELSDQEVSDLRVLPRKKGEKQREHFSTLTLRRLTIAIHNYLQLWKRFRQSEYVTRSSNGSEMVREEVEQDLLELLRYGKQFWGRSVTCKLMANYLIDNPKRIASLSRPLLGVLAPDSIVSRYRKLRKFIVLA